MARSNDRPEPDDPREGWGPDGPEPDGSDPLGAGSPQAHGEQPPRRRGLLDRLFGGRTPQPQPEPLDPAEAEELARRQADPTGLLEYTAERGWAVVPDESEPSTPPGTSDTSGTSDASRAGAPSPPEHPDKAEANRLLGTMPNYPGPRYTAAHVVRGRSDPHLDSLATAISGLRPADAPRDQAGPAGLDSGTSGASGGSWDILAFEATYDDARWREVHSAVTAVPVLVPLPAVRLMPTRFPMRRAGGMLVIPSDDDEFDARWRLLAAEDTPAVRALTGATVRAGLLSGPDLDELWAAEGHLMISRLDLLSPPLLRWHVALLAAMVDEIRQSLGAD